jgi:peroxiredoxin
MKKSVFLLCIFFAPVFARAQQSDPSTLTKLGDPAPTFDFHITKKQTVNLKDYKGKIVMINFFATWCKPCGYELIRVRQKIWDKYKDNPKFALFFFGRNEGWDVILPFKQKNGFPFLMLPDQGSKIFKLFATQSIPRTLLLDENQNIIYQSIGYDENELKKLLALLNEKLK